MNIVSIEIQNSAGKKFLLKKDIDTDGVNTISLFEKEDHTLIRAGRFLVTNNFVTAMIIYRKIEGTEPNIIQVNEVIDIIDWLLVPLSRTSSFVKQDSKGEGGIS